MEKRGKTVVVFFLTIVLSSVLFAKQKVYTVGQNLYWLEHKMSLSQFDLIKKIWKYAKPYDLSWTAVAIAWHEGHLGKELHNLADPSCGIFHQLLPDLAERYHMRGNMWNYSRLCDNLMNFDYAFKTFIDTFHIKENICYNRGYRSKGTNWRCAVMAYNTYGNRSYYKNIVNKIKALKKFFKKHKMNLNGEFK